MANSKDTRNDFTKGEMWRCITGMAIPLMLAQLVNVLYSIVDRIYIGHIPGVGTLALTGLGLSMPVITLVTAFSNLCGTGGAPLCSIARGAGDLERAERIMGNSFSMLLSIGVLITIVAQILLKPMLYAFGASDTTIPYAMAYARIYVCGTVFVMISIGMNLFINSQGFAKIGMLSVTIGAVVNIILDPILIFACNMGIQGAAYATVFAQLCSAVWVLRFLTGKKAILKLRLSSMKPDGKTMLDIVKLGITGFIMQFTNSLVQISCNSQLARYGGDLYVGAMTVINSVREFLFMIVHGLTEAAKPVLGFNYGARKYSRVKSGIRFVTFSGVAYSIIIWIVLMLIPGVLVSVFNKDPELLELCVPALKIYFCGFAFMSLQMAGQCVFTGLGRAKEAVTFSLLRKVVIVVTLVYLLPSIPLFGVNGVFWAEPISDLLGGAACFITMYFTVYKKLGEDEN